MVDVSAKKVFVLTAKLQSKITCAQNFRQTRHMTFPSPAEFCGLIE